MNVPFFVDDDRQLIAVYDDESHVVDVRSTADESLPSGELCALFGVDDEASALGRAHDASFHAYRRGEVL